MVVPARAGWTDLQVVSNVEITHNYFTMKADFRKFARFISVSCVFLIYGLPQGGTKNLQ